MKKIAMFILLSSAALFSGCFLSPQAGQGPSQVSAEEPSAPVIGHYNLKALDPLYISFLGIPKETQMETVIDEYGEISLPYIDDAVIAAGKSVSELEREIQRLYVDGGIYRTVTVNIQTSAKSYFMEGEVRRPQEYPLNRKITLLQAIAAAGGYTEYADPKDVVITRRGENIKVNAKDFEKNPEKDIPIEAGDRINVDRSWM